MKTLTNKKSGEEYIDISNHPIIKRYLYKLESFIKKHFYFSNHIVLLPYNVIYIQDFQSFYVPY